MAGEAGALFLYCAQRVQPGFQVQGQEAAIVTVCQQVEGMPLALELADSWGRVMPCVEIARRIQHDFDFLTTPLRNLPERHRSLRSLFDQSWCLLSPLEQDVLLRANGQQRFDLHELVRHYAAEQLAVSGEGDQIRQRHYTAYLGFFRIGDSHLRGPQAASWVPRLEAELDNLRTTLQWAIDTTRYMDTTWLMLATCCFWAHRGLYEEGHHWFAQLLTQRQVLPTDLRLAIMIWYNPFANKLHASQRIEGFWDELLALQESTDIAALRAGFWFFYSAQATDSTTAAHALEQVVAYARTASAAPAIAPEHWFYTDYDFILGTALWCYAACLIDLGNVTTATNFARESSDFFQSRNRFERFGGLSVLGRLAFLAGDIAEARRYLQEAVKIVTTAQELEQLHEQQPRLGLVTFYCGDLAEARRLLDESLALCLRMKSLWVAARVCAYLAEVVLWQEDLSQSAQWLAQSLAYGTKTTRVTIDEMQRLWVAARLAATTTSPRRHPLWAGRTSAQPDPPCDRWPHARPGG